MFECILAVFCWRLDDVEVGLFAVPLRSMNHEQVMGK